MAIIDVITYNGEKELLDLRYNILKDYVDEFRVISFDKTFSGQKREKLDIDFSKYEKARFYWIEEDDSSYTVGYNKYRELAESSPNTEGAEHWKTEFMMKESIKDCLTGLDDDDIIYIGDCDEIWQPFPVVDDKIFKLKLNVYTYWLNNRSSEEFWGTIVGKYKNIKDKCLNHIRSTYHYKTQIDWGWHFTSMGGYEKVKEKLTDSYTKDSYATDEVLNHLENNIKESKDFLGRKFAYLVDESQWPIYLKEHRDNYKYLLIEGKR